MIEARDALFDAMTVFGAAQQADTVVVRSPGRVNLIGEHIDYSGGLVLPMAVDRGTTAVALPRRDRLVRGYSANFAEAGIVTADLDSTAFDPSRGWFSYVLAVLDTAIGDGLVPSAGFDVYLSGDLPDGAGLSSSASVELATATLLEQLFGFGQDPTRWAVLCQRAENDYVGVACGIMDQLAVACGVAGHALLMDCTTLHCDPVPMPASVTVVIANTNQPRQLAGSAYNDRRAATERAGQVIGTARGRPVERLVDVTAAELAEHAAELSQAGVLAEARHTVTEQQRVVDTAEALRIGDLGRVGELMRQSHESLRDDFRVTGPALDALAEAAWAAPGVIGARMTGAGFGGCTVNLVHTDHTEPAMAAITAGYQQRTGVTPDVFPVQPSDGAHVLDPYE